MVTTKGVLRINCLYLGDELAEWLLFEFQDTSKVTQQAATDNKLRLKALREQEK